MTTGEFQETPDALRDEQYTSLTARVIQAALNDEEIMDNIKKLGWTLEEHAKSAAIIVAFEDGKSEYIASSGEVSRRLLKLLERQTGNVQEDGGLL